MPALRQVRDLYWTVRNFRQRVLDFLRYRRVTANLDERFQVHSQSVPAVYEWSKHLWCVRGLGGIALNGKCSLP